MTITAYFKPEAYWYLGSPYTDYAFGIDAASVAACEAAGLLLDAGVKVFSPIAHFHAIRRIIGERPHDYWMTADRPFMVSACGLIVLKMAGWRDSKSLQIEIAYFAQRNLTIVQMIPGTAPTELCPPSPR